MMQDPVYIKLTVYRPEVMYNDIMKYLISLIGIACEYTEIQAEQCVTIIMLKGEYDVMIRPYSITTHQYMQDVCNLLKTCDILCYLNFKLELINQPV